LVDGREFVVGGREGFAGFVRLDRELTTVGNAAAKERSQTSASGRASGVVARRGTTSVSGLLFMAYPICMTTTVSPGAVASAGGSAVG
jgi:hypothetical protein